MNAVATNNIQSEIADKKNNQSKDAAHFGEEAIQNLNDKVEALEDAIQTHKTLLLSLSGMIHGLIRSGGIDRENVLNFIRSTSYSESRETIFKAENHARIIMSDAATRNFENANDAEYIVEFD